jgi:hypothetical protein
VRGRARYEEHAERVWALPGYARHQPVDGEDSIAVALIVLRNFGAARVGADYVHARHFRRVVGGGGGGVCQAQPPKGMSQRGTSTSVATK